MLQIESLSSALPRMEENTNSKRKQTKNEDIPQDGINLDLSSIHVYKSTVSPIKVENKVFEANTNIGLRPTQEDRLLLIPRFFHDEISFAGIFDGTVGHHASEFIMHNIAPHLLDTEEMKEILHLANYQSYSPTPPSKEAMATKVRAALRSTFLNVDSSLIEMCREKEYHYASSTGVAAFLWRDLLTIAHVGDSKACIAKMSKDGQIRPEWLTVDHKPNMPMELQRIERSGGSLAWLHGNKPYIRGGDFLRRQANGEHPKQLNYSRAFGGKDLKMYGLTAEPEINHFEIDADDKLVLIASDGLWDVLNPKVACEIALRAKAQGRSATQDIVQCAINDMPNVGVRDNVSVIAIFFD